MLSREASILLAVSLFLFSFVIWFSPVELAYATENTWQVEEATDDAANYTGTEGFQNDDNAIYVGYRDVSSYYVGDGYFRWTPIDIPQGYGIYSAYLKIYVVSGIGSAKTKIYGIDEDDTATFSSNPDGRSLTSASVDWDGTWSNSAWNTSPDISDVIQEVVDRSGWQSGNALGLKLADDGSGQDSDNYIQTETNETGNDRAAKLEITYTQYRYTFMGPYNEEDGTPSTSTVVTAHYEAQSNENFTVDGTYEYTPLTLPLYFHFELGTYDHEYWLSEGETQETIYIFTATLTEYTIQFIDIGGILDQYSFISARCNINGTQHTVEKRQTDVNDRVVLSLIQSKRYNLLIEDAITYDYGWEYFGADVTIELILKAIDFPDEVILAYRYVRLYAERHNNFTSISMLYQDTEGDTDHVDCRIKYRNGSIANSTTRYADSFNATWPSAQYNLTYYVEMDAYQNNYGELNYRATMYRGGFGITPWGLDWLGSIPHMNTYTLIPIFLVFGAALVFSKVNAYVGAFISTILAILFVWWGWLNISGGILVAALVFSLLMAIGYKKRRVYGS